MSLQDNFDGFAVEVGGGGCLILTRLLVMEKNYARMYVALESLVYNYAHFGRVTDTFVADVGRILQEIDG